MTRRDGSRGAGRTVNRAARSARVLLCLTSATLIATCRSSEAAGVVTLRFWAMGREGEVVEALVRDFEREHPGIAVRVQQIPWTAAHEKLLTAHVGEATPDIAQLGNTWIAEFQAMRALEPLDRWIAASADVKAEAFFPGIWDTNVIDGQVLGVPWYVDTRLIFYRKDLLAGAGYARPPATWTEWRAAMQAVRRQGGGERYGIFLPTNEWAQPIIFGLQAGSPLLGEHASRGAFSEPEFRRAFEFYVGLYRDTLAPRLGTTDMANLYQEFERGLFAMYITGPWNIGEFERRLTPAMKGKWGTAPLPAPDADTARPDPGAIDGGSAPPARMPGVSLAGGSSLVVFERSRHKAAAWKLVEFLSRPRQQLRFYELTGDLPARREAWQSRRLIGNEFARPFWDQLQHVRATPKIPEWELIATKVLDFAERSIRGGEAPEQTLRKLDAEVDRILEKRRWMVRRQAERAMAGAR